MYNKIQLTIAQLQPYSGSELQCTGAYYFLNFKIIIMERKKCYKMSKKVTFRSPFDTLGSDHLILDVCMILDTAEHLIVLNTIRAQLYPYIIIIKAHVQGHQDWLVLLLDHPALRNE